MTVKETNKYCLGNQTKFLIFLRNDRDCMVVDPYKARKRYTATESYFYVREKKLDSTKNSYKISFPATTKNDTTAQLYCTISM